MDLHNGLSQDRARQRLDKYGPNRLVNRSQIYWWHILIAQLKSPLVYILLLVIPVVWFLKQYWDLIFISVVVISNTILGFIQEYRNQKILEALNKLLVPKAKVKRDGKWVELDAANLVPGDVVRLEIGQSVPADGVLVQEDTLHMNEAFLTGESVQVKKNVYVGQLNDDNLFGVYDLVDPTYRCLAGSTVVQGIGEMVVVYTGNKTRMGHIAQQVAQDKDEQTPLQIKMGVLSNKLGLTVAIIIGLVCLIGFVKAISFQEILPVAIALSVAGIPEGLVISLTVSLTLGMKRILKRKALIRRLMAAETLGVVDVICLDKTGTLTEGQMKANGGLTLDDKKLTWLARGAVLCNDFRDPLEIAMDEWALGYLKINKSEELQRKFPRTDELPFDPKTKYIVTRHHQPEGGLVEFMSGAPEVVLKYCQISTKELEEWKQRFVEAGTKGYRMVGFAYKLVDKGEHIEKDSVHSYQWLGIVTFVDPIRPGVVQNLKLAMDAGIDLKVITGDYKETAWAILQQVGLVKSPLDMSKVVLGDELESLTGKALMARVETAVLFARTTPEQKDLIVQALQGNKHVVGMMGDGVNDAPALKRADIGVVVDGASDVARETADLLLLDNDFGTLLAAIEEGRSIFESLRKVILYLLSDAYSGVIMAVVSLALGWPLPLVATQILWVTFVHDSFMYLALTAEPKAKDLLKRKPLKRDEAIVNKDLIKLTLLIAVSVSLFVLGIFGWQLYIEHHSLILARTITMATFSLVTLLFVFSARVLSRPLWSESIFTNPWLIVSLIGGIFLGFGVLYVPVLQQVLEVVPLSFTHWIQIFGVALGMMVFVEGSKLVMFGKHNR